MAKVKSTTQNLTDKKKSFKKTEKQQSKEHKEYKEKKVALVTGACGFNGSHMVDLLLENGYRVRATDLPNSNRKFVSAKAEFMPADITKKDTLYPVIDGVDYIFHPAAIFDYEAPWELCEKVNVFGTENLCDVAVEKNVKRFILFSTVSVYGYPKPDELPVKEDNPKRPGTNYEKSKWLQEGIVEKYYHEKKLPISIIRPAPVYGPRNNYGVATLLFLIAKFPIIPFPINIEAPFVCVNVKDVVGAALFVAEKSAAIGEAYNLVDDAMYDMKEFVEFVCPLLGVKVIPTFIPRELLFYLGNQAAMMSRSVAKIVGGRPLIEKDMVYYLKANYSFSNEKIKKLGYQLLYPDCAPGFEETIEWYHKNGYLKENMWRKMIFH